MRRYCQQAARVEDCGSYRRSQCMASLDDEAVAQARVEFRKYRLDGVILDGDFDMDEWHLYDEVRNYRFDFGIDGETYEEGAGQWTGLPCESFKERTKAYVVLRMGSYSLETLRITVINLREIAVASMDGLGRMPSKKIQAQAIDFLTLAGRGGTDMDDVVEMLEEKYNAASFRPSGSRNLAGFGDYFIFDREQRNYWENADRKEKAGAFPVWLWWNLTAILPLRPTEFLTMPWDCLGKYGGGYVLTVRRTLQKKGVHRYRYHVADDYGLYNYHIPEKLADEIKCYREWTEPLRGGPRTGAFSSHPTKKGLDI